MQEQELKTVDNINANIPQPVKAPLQTEAKAAPVFCIRIASIGFLVSVTKFCEVLDRIQVNALPNVHPWISGIVNLRGNLVPVFDLRVVLDETGDNTKRRLFAVDRGEKAVALWIDNYPEIKNKNLMKPVKKLPKLPESINRLLVGAYEQEGQVWLDINFEELFKTLGRHQYATEETAA